ncbi:MAG TPA: hypothetical protein EYO84_06910 [Planctomycetes bacterium]|nr:hypothetical protein [Planctomycetota bacterium]
MPRNNKPQNEAITQFLRRIDEVDAKFSQLLDETADTEILHELSSQWMHVRLELERELLDKVLGEDGLIPL